MLKRPYPPDVSPSNAIRWLATALVLALLLTACLPAQTPAPPATLPATAPPVQTLISTPTATRIMTARPLPTRTPAPTVEPPHTPASTLWVFPDAGASPLLKELAGASSSLHMYMYLLSDARAIQALKDAARRGVDVRVILEQEPFGGGAGNAQAAQELRAAGVSVQWGNPVFRYTHAKAIIIDRSRLIILTGNLTSSTFTNNRDLAILDGYPEDVAEALRVFEADWQRAGIDLRSGRLIWSPDNSRQRILGMLNAAGQRIDLEEQSLQDEEVIAVLLRCLARGVQVRLISSPHSPLEQDPNEPGRQRLRNAGAQVRYLSSPYIHAKMFIVDDRVAYLGSHNLTTTSLDFNRELGLAITDAGLIEQLRRVFDKDWAQARVTVREAGGPAEIDHTQAGSYIGREMKVRLTVTHVYNSGKVIWLMGNADQEHNFKVVIFPSDYAKWPASPDQYYFGKTIRVHGLIKLYRGWPEIVVKDPGQIEVLAPAGG
ncbi:MAG: phospholipase D-like domain-containing protein [Anaerolineae bacterium]